MTVESFLDGKVFLHPGDCLEVLKTLAPNSIDACVTDPPYHLTSIVKRFGADNAAPAKAGKTGAYVRASRGFMSKVWDGGDIAFRLDAWREVLRVLKPGAYIVAFSSSRTYHRMACAIEDAGFITHPLVAWITGQGFPKAHSVSKHLDRIAGAEREIVGQYIAPDGNPRGVDRGIQGGNFANGHAHYVAEKLVTGPATDAAREWDGWFYGTQSLKPAIEPIYVGQKPFEKGLNGTQNILKWGTGALNIDGTRVGVDTIKTVMSGRTGGTWEGNCGLNGEGISEHTGRWPANVILDSSEEVQGAFPETGAGAFPAARGPGGIGNNGHSGQDGLTAAKTDSGSAARFFYTAKADNLDRIGSRHPTVKPLDLMQYLCRLITPPRGTVLDCFAGTGTTGEAAWREGFSAILIEREAEYQNDIRRRMALCMSGPDERQRESIKERMKGKPEDHGPLFASSEVAT